MKTLFLFILSLFIFAGCSSKQYFEPKEDIYVLQEPKYSIGYKITDFNPNGATLEDNLFVSKQGFDGTILPKGYKFLNIDDDTIIAADNNKTLLLKDNEKEVYFTFENNIVSASKKGYLLALTFDNNSIMIFDTLYESIRYKEYFQHSELNDIKIASSVFLESIVLIPTLDGKIVIVDLESYKTVKTINIDPKNDINNIIYLANINESLVAATQNKLFVFSGNRTFTNKMNIKFVVLKDDSIYAATLEGEIIKYNIKLEKLASKKFTFAKFHALSVTENGVYALESQGYMIKLDKNLEKSEIYDYDFDEKEKVLSIGNKIYTEDSYIELP